MPFDLRLHSKLLNAGHLQLDRPLQFTLIQMQGGTIDGVQITVPETGQVSGWGSIGQNLNNYGLVRVGGEEALVIGSAFSQYSVGSLAIEIGAESAPFVIQGSASLAGQLLVSAPDSFEPAPDQVFPLFSVKGPVTGLFDGVVLPPLPPGVEWDDSELYSDGILVVRGVPNTYETWIASFEATISDPADQQPFADPAGDGIPNLLKYAFGMDPAVVSRQGLPVISTTPHGEEGLPYLTLTITKAPDTSGIMIIPEVSASLEDEWRSGPEHLAVVDENDTELIVRDRIPAGESRERYLRVRVELTTDDD